MIALDPQLERIQIILNCPRPQAEPAEGELRAVLEHLGATAQAHEAEAGTAEAAR